jgi:signal transduction histidine kinase
VPLLLAGFLILLSVHALLPRTSVLHDPILLALIWAGGSFLIRASNGKQFGMWSGAAITLVCALLLARALGYAGSVSSAALRSFGTALLAAVPLGILFRFGRKTRSLPVVATFVAVSLWIGLAAVDVVGCRGLATRGLLARAPELLLALCTGWLVFQEAYPERTAWGGSLPGLTGREGMMHSLHARLLATENALVGQERITAAGFLALGAAHEFKNTLSLVRLAADHGLARKEPGEKDASLRLIVDQTNTARDSAIEVLERIAATGGEEACTLDAARDLTGPLRRAGAALRAEGIILEMDLGAEVTFRARRLDVEQIILNLIHNAAESYRTRPSEENRTIEILGKTEDECAVIEVRDSAGGVDEIVRHRLFAPSLSGSRGSGLGLYLSRNLALSNGGSLEYQPLEGGSAFILALPAAIEPDETGPRLART